MDLAGFAADAFGLSQPQVSTETAHQDDPNDSATASVKKSFTVSHAGSLQVTTSLANDIDLYLLRDVNNDGQFTANEIVASSATGSGDEAINVSRPVDGNYQVWVHGFAVSGTPTFPLTIDAVQGHDLTVTGLPAGAVPGGTPVTLHVAYSKGMTTGQTYKGELHLGPTTAPDLLVVPIVVHRQ